MTGRSSGHVRNLGLASLGAVLEYFDFVVYVYVAAAIAGAFFPAHSSTWITSLETFGIYAIGYLVRPVAAVVIAHFSDQIGRKKLFLFTVLLMSVPTFLMGLLPTYAQVGWVAPAALLILRILQGCAVGGELPGAAVFIAEHAPERRLGLHSGIYMAVVNCGLLLGAGAAKLAAVIATHYPQYGDLQWRLPFMFGGAFGLMSAYLRRSLDETPLFAQIRAQGRKSKRIPLVEVFLEYKAACAIVLGMVFVFSMSSGTFFQWLPNHLITRVHVSRDVVFSANMAGVIAFVLAIPAWGWINDKLGWARGLVVGAVVGACAATWFFHQLGGANPGGNLLGAYVVVGLAIGCMHSSMAGLIASLFPTPVRQTGFATPYSVGTALFTGPIPLVLAWLAGTLGLNAGLFVYLSACGLTCVIALSLSRVSSYLGRNVKEAKAPAPVEISRT